MKCKLLPIKHIVCVFLADQCQCNNTVEEVVGCKGVTNVISLPNQFVCSLLNQQNFRFPVSPVGGWSIEEPICKLKSFQT